MPLFHNARTLIQANLECCRLGTKPSAVAIGCLTKIQLDAINAKRVEDQLRVIAAEVVFIGLHLFKSRALKDGYSIEDMLDQIESAMCAESTVIAIPII